MSWHCDCSDVRLLSEESYKKNFHQLKNINCYERNTSIYQFKNDYCLYEFQPLIYIIVLVTTLVLLVVVLIVLLTCHWFKIKILLHPNKLTHWWINEGDSKTDKKYAIFISFCHKDEDFVLKELIPKIEERKTPYSICIHIRDWVAGEWIDNNIIKSVTESKCTLIILSENFIQSFWGMSELKVAYIQLLLRRETKIIIILFEEFRKLKNLEFELNSYLLLSTIIEWKDPLFWKKLFMALLNHTF